MVSPYTKTNLIKNSNFKSFASNAVTQKFSKTLLASVFLIHFWMFHNFFEGIVIETFRRSLYRLLDFTIRHEKFEIILLLLFWHAGHAKEQFKIIEAGNHNFARNPAPSLLDKAIQKNKKYDKKRPEKTQNITYLINIMGNLSNIPLWKHTFLLLSKFLPRLCNFLFYVTTLYFQEL